MEQDNNMSFLPDWWSQGTNAYTPENKFGQAGMFDKPSASQQGDFGGYLQKLIAMLRKGQDTQGGMDITGQTDNAPQTNSLPSFTPYQGESMAPQMGKVNSPLAVSPNGQIMPNWNRTYGGY